MFGAHVLSWFGKKQKRDDIELKDNSIKIYAMMQWSDAHTPVSFNGIRSVAYAYHTDKDSSGTATLQSRLRLHIGQGTADDIEQAHCYIVTTGE